MTYKPFGPISSLEFGNGVRTTLLYDADYCVTRITATSTPNWDYTYHYDAAGNVDQLTDQIGTNDRLYAYDRLDRLTQDNKTLFGAAGLVEYQYDAGGNRTLWKQIVSQAQTYAATSNRQTQYGSTLLLQDAAGNLTAYGTKLFSYDSANRMSMAVTGSTTTTYCYNGLGQRTTKLATTGGNTVVTHYDYDKDGKYLGQVQLNPDGTYAQGDDYIWLDDMPIAQVHTTYGINNTIASQQLTYIHADHLNTPRGMTDSTKKIVWKWESEAYGRTAPNTDPDGDAVLNRLDLRFPGQIADVETGFYYNMNRYYDPVTGRYTQSDSIGIRGGLNTYAYALDNPLRYVDPYGLYCLTEAEIQAIAGGVGGGIGGAVAGGISGAKFGVGGAVAGAIGGGISGAGAGAGGGAASPALGGSAGGAIAGAPGGVLGIGAGALGGGASGLTGGGYLGGTVGGAIGGFGGSAGVVGGAIGGLTGAVAEAYLRAHNECDSCEKK